MRFVEPKVFLIGETKIVEEGLQAYLEHVGASSWSSDAPSDIERIIEAYGRLCYRSWKPGLNPNVTKIREENVDYLGNILKVGHGSVLEHGFLNFIFADVSRVFTHELVRHRVGVAISQESLRYVRLSKLRAWLPTVIKNNKHARELFSSTYELLEKLQLDLAEHFKLDDPGLKFSIKKAVTSAMRRLAPIGLATTIGWSVNPRTLRHTIEMRTAPGAEEEIRFVFGKVAELVKDRYPNIFGDYEIEIIDGLPWYKTKNSKV